MKAYIFPGQGSQFVGMGKELYENSPLAKELFEQANEIIGFRISDMMFAGTEEDLKQTFKDKVIPLLEEYFFGDLGKISLVLGNSFITKSSKSAVLFAKNNEYDPSIANDLLERGVYEITTDNWNFKSIYQ